MVGEENGRWLIGCSNRRLDCRMLHGIVHQCAARSLFVDPALANISTKKRPLAARIKSMSWIFISDFSAWNLIRDGPRGFMVAKRDLKWHILRILAPRTIMHQFV